MAAAPRVAIPANAEAIARRDEEDLQTQIKIMTALFQKQVMAELTRQRAAKCERIPVELRRAVAHVAC